MPTNPLLATDALPRFDLFSHDHVVPAIGQLLPELRAELRRLEGLDEPEWDALVGGLERLQGRFGFAWGMVLHLHRVKNTPELRAAHDAVQRDIITFDLEMRQSKAIFDKLLALQAALDDPSDAQRRTLEGLIKSRRLAGIGLEDEERARFNAIETELAELGTRFRNNQMDAAVGWAMDLESPDEVAGLPETVKRLAAQDARRHGAEGATSEGGPWRFTLSASSYRPFLDYSARRDLREKIYRASRRMAGEGERDNRPIIARVLSLRAKQAALLGFSTWAELSVHAKMADSVEDVYALLDTLEASARPVAEADLEAIRELARRSGAEEANDLRPWDMSFWSEQLKQDSLELDTEEVRQYFPFEHVLSGLFALTEELFGVRIEAADGQTSTWHPDVRFFRVVSLDTDQTLAWFFVDPFSRPEEKISGAWHGSCFGRSRHFAPPGAPERLPVSYLVCNQTPPSDEGPSLMTFGEVKTLFHEFGHGLHHLLTTVDEGYVAGGRNVEWDFIEVPSKFMENWCYQPATLRRITSHVDTGAAMPDVLIARLRRARTFQMGYFVHMQIYLSVLDLDLHHHFDPTGEESVDEAFARIRDRFMLVAPLDEGDHFLCSFAHIFAGGYAAGYYSYKWSEVLSADAFSVFEDAGLVDSEALARVGRRYRDTILALGGSLEPARIFEAFVGRKASVEAFLAHNGLKRAS